VKSLRLVGLAVLAVLAMVFSTGTATAATEISLGTHNTLHGDGSFEQFAGVIGWQEVDTAAAQDKLRNRLDANYATFFPDEGPAKSVPISWRKDRFTLLGSGSVRTHDGEAEVTPARYVNWVHLQVGSTRFIVVNTHFISGAWSGHPERQARWNKHLTVLQDKVADLQRNHPQEPVFVLGDFNRAQAVNLPSPLQHVAVTGVSGVPIDQMYAPSTLNHSKVTRHSQWGSDHHAYSMLATL